MTRRLRWPTAILAYLGVLLGTASAQETGDEQCADCHDEVTLTESVHTDLDCVDCHVGVAAEEHKQTPAPPNCGECHEDSVSLWQGSIHGVLHDDKVTAACSDCHGDHNIRASGDKRSTVHALNLARTCGACHRLATDANSDPDKSPHALYIESVHGRALSKGGLVVAAHCSSCHGYHDVRDNADPSARMHRNNVAATCGECHVGIVDQYQEGIHGQRVAAGDADAPVCFDCHTSHEIRRANDTGWQLAVIKECGSCHPESLHTYRDSFHGQVTALGFTRVARCSSCHGAHAIQPREHEDSTINAANIVGTCQTCHARANANFVQYDPHADPKSRARSPVLYYVGKFMRWLIVGVLAFFGLHVVLWLMRSLLARRKKDDEDPQSNPSDATYYLRFTVGQRVLHGFLMLSVFGLTATGLPLLYSHSAWAVWLSHTLGGFAVMGFLHRVCAVALSAVSFLHLVDMGRRVFVHKEKGLLWGSRSIVPQPRDFIDLFRSFRWFFGLGEPPRFARYTYWEKFDYWAVFWGMAIIGASGFVLWFHDLFAKFVPGWWFNVALLIHSEEALLATTFIILIHFFNSHLRPEKFPMDLVIFTGRVSEDELKKERPEEYEGLVDAGTLASTTVDAPPPWLKRFGWIVGGVAVVIGLVLLVLIVVIA